MGRCRSERNQHESPWTAKPLTDASKNAKFRAVMDLSAERVILGRSAIVIGWVLGGVGVTAWPHR